MGTQSDFRVKKNLIVGDGIISSGDNANLVLRRDFDDTTYNEITLTDDTFKITLDNSHRLFIDGNGKVGIGVTSPDEKLDVRSSATPKLLVRTTATSSEEAHIIIGGARTTSTTADISRLIFNTYDSDIGGSESNTLAEITVRKEAASGDQGNLLFKTNSGDDSIVERMRITKDGSLELSNGTPASPAADRVRLTETGGTLRIDTQHGYIGFGPSNTSWGHISTDRGKFYMNKPLVIDGGSTTGGGYLLSAYDAEDMVLATGSGADDRLTIKADTGYVGIGTIVPKKTLHISDGSTSGITGGTTAALLITDDSNPRIYFEALDEASGNRVYDIAVGNDSFDGFSFNSLNNTAGGYENQNIMTIHADGNVGIGTGTATPDKALEVKDDTNLGGIEITGTGVNTSLTINNTGTNGGEYRMSVTSGNHGDGANKLLFQDGTLARMTLNSSGNLGIGVTAPSTRLHLKTDNDSNFPQLKIDNAGTGDAALFFTAGSVWSMGVDNSDSDKFKISQDNSNAYLHTNTMFTINTSGRVGIGTSSPGYMIDVQAADAHVRLKDTSDTDDMYIVLHGSDGNEYGCLGYNGTSVFQIRSPQGRVINLGGHANTKVGVTTADMTFTPTALLHVNGSFKATTKSFDIEHPTKEGMRLHHGVLEGPEHGVYIRGHQVGDTIELPDYWLGLVDEDTITVQLTAKGRSQNLYVKSVDREKVVVGGFITKSPDFYYFIQAERKDVDKMEVEYGSVD
jgi:hypothetical protein